MCRNRTMGRSGTRLYSSLPLSNVARNAVMMCMQTCYCAYKPIGYPFLEFLPLFRCIYCQHKNDYSINRILYLL